MKTPFTCMRASGFDKALSHRKGKFLKQSCVSTRPAPCKIVEHMQNTFLLHSRRRRRRAGNQAARIIICCALQRTHLYIYSKVRATQSKQGKRDIFLFTSARERANSWKDFVPRRGHSIFTPPNPCT